MTPSTLLGGAGNDQLWSIAGGASSYGGDGNDVLVGGAYLDGGEGADLVIAVAANSFAYGSLGDDSLWAGAGTNLVTLNGGVGADILVGNGLNDRLIAGNDTVRDIMIGGVGRDEFDEGGHGDKTSGQLAGGEQFPSSLNTDIIWNFQIGTDILVIPQATFFSPGVFSVYGSYSTVSGYNNDLGLSGTLLRWDFFRGLGGFYQHQDMVFLAGVNTTLALLQSSSSIQFNDSVVNA